MKLQLNGVPVQSNAVTLAELLDEQGFGGSKVATAVNGTFVPGAVRGDHKLDAGDQIEVLAPMQGG